MKTVSPAKSCSGRCGPSPTWPAAPTSSRSWRGRSGTRWRNGRRKKRGEGIEGGASFSLGKAPLHSPDSFLKQTLYLFFARTLCNHRHNRLAAEDAGPGKRNVGEDREQSLDVPVSYTHLTLPTSDLV